MDLLELQELTEMGVGPIDALIVRQACAGVRGGRHAERVLELDDDGGEHVGGKAEARDQHQRAANPPERRAASWSRRDR
jgi:hypothetical protein